MAYTTDTRRATWALRDRFNSFLADLADRRARAKVYRATYNELSALTDRELNDLGLSRSGIRAVAYEAAYGN